VDVGRYQILDVIGTGATGRVARASDPLINRIVAIKLFSKELAEGQGRQRFLQEARVVGQISHPCIITLHDMGIDEASSTPYLVMEFVQGRPLDRVLEKGSVPVQRASAWMADIASALAAAHHKGVIHGDVKPANILITDEGRIKLMDFGMARLASRDAKDTPLLGTPAYWCPEQIAGRPQDARSDIFSLGVVLYEMLTGHKPFDGDSLQAICTRILSSTPLPPSQTNPSIPVALGELITACLAKDPAQRPSSAAALAKELVVFARRRKADAVAGRPQAVPLQSHPTRVLRTA
jgi:serine/threonine-protein kinase